MFVNNNGDGAKMEEVLCQLRALPAATGIRQVKIAERMGMDPTALSRVLNGHLKSLPDGFEARFRAAVAELAEEKARRRMDAVRADVQAMLSAAGVAA